jgi:hypothetical protein
MESKYGKKHVKWLLAERKKRMGEHWTYRDYKAKYEELKLLTFK